jgi:hypothetical protein
MFKVYWERRSMTVHTLTGWQFWVRDSGRLRAFIVAINDFAEAEQKALAQTTDGSTISYQQAPADLMKFLQLPGEKIVELIAVDVRHETAPSNDI